MTDLTLWLSLGLTGLIIGLLISLAVAAIINGFCEYLSKGSSQRFCGLSMLLIYLPLFAWNLHRMMAEVLYPMLIGILCSSAVISLSVYRQNIRALKNPLSLPKAG
jgi:hypothetical protein